MPDEKTVGRVRIFRNKIAHQQVLDMGGTAVGQLEGVLGCTIQEAFLTYSGREGLGTQWAPGPEIASQDRRQQDRQDTV